MFLTELGPSERVELCQKVFAFMDTHPIELGEKPQSSNSEILPADPEAADQVSEISKAKFQIASQNSEDLQEIIKQKSKTINLAVAASEEK